MKKKITMLVAVLMVAVLAVGCSCQGGSKSSANKTMVIGDTTFNSENSEESVNPHNTYNGWACIRYGIGETLVHYTDDMNLEPWIANKWENDGGNNWTITLNDNVKFSNGKAVDAAAVKECFEHMIQAHDRAPSDTKIASMEANGNVLKITTSEPNPALMNYLGDPYACIIDMQSSNMEQGIVTGTGPYVVQEMVTDDHLTLTPNTNYWNGTPKLSKLTIKTISDGDTLSAALQTGDIDAAYGMAYEAYPNFENNKYQFSSIQTSRTFFTSMNMESPVISDKAVREAIAYGINKEGFVNTLLNGHGVVGAGAFPDGFSNFGGDKVKNAKKYNPETAKATLEAAGWVDTDGDGIREKNGQKLTIKWLTYPSRQELPLLAESAQASLKDIGINVEINNTANHKQFRKDKSSWDIYASALVTAPSGDPLYFFTTSCLPGSDYNYAGYDNPNVTKLVGDLSKEFDATKRGEIAVKLQDEILADDAYVFCSFLQMNLISKSNVKNYTAHACDYYEVTADLDIE
ncbi:MAG: ABC transporter substrate-binding protein [Lachnospiraceae bacterium]|nr:ABC transporter substrate-binding protein [Lachnospiraceae bacterium]